MVESWWYLCRKKIEKQVNFFLKNPDKLIVTGHFESLDFNNKVTIFSYEKNFIFENGWDVLTKWNHFCAMLINKKCFMNLRFNEKNSDSQDLEMQLQLVKRHKIYSISEIVLRQRVHLSSGTHLDLKSHLKRKKVFIKNLIPTYGFDFFKSKKIENPTEYKILVMFGDFYMKNSQVNISRYYYCKALLQKPYSIKIILFILFGKLGWNFFYRWWDIDCLINKNWKEVSQ